MNKGFTLVEVLAVLAIIGILAVIIFPIIQIGISDNSKTALQIQQNTIVKASKDWSLKNISKLPENGNSVMIKLGDLKDEYLPLNIKNPDTGAILSNESYVLITEKSGNYTYEVFIYDIPDYVDSSGTITFHGNFLLEELNLNDSLGEYNISVTDIAGNELSYSKQYFLDNNEISNISTETKNTYSIVYTVLYNDKIYKAVKTIIIK